MLTALRDGFTPCLAEVDLRGPMNLNLLIPVNFGLHKGLIRVGRT